MFWQELSICSCSSENWFSFILASCSDDSITNTNNTNETPYDLNGNFES